jgi:hypothetical protein
MIFKLNLINLIYEKSMVVCWTMDF